MFKRKKGIKLSYFKQGFVYFYCANYKSLSKSKRLSIDRLCEEVGDGDGSALRAFLISADETALSISQKYFMSEKKLFRLRAKFYEEFWNRRIFEK